MVVKRISNNAGILETRTLLGISQAQCDDDAIINKCYKYFLVQIHIRSVDGVYHHNVSINVSDAEKNIKETSNVLQYVVDFSLYPPNSSISFTVS